MNYEPRTDRQVTIGRKNSNRQFGAPFLPEAWRKIANTPEAGELVLNIVPDSAKVADKDIATVSPDPKNPRALVLHALQKGKTELTFDVTTEYGDKWTLRYDVVVNR